MFPETSIAEIGDRSFMSEKIRAFFAPQNLTEGPILKGLVRFSIPLILGNFA